MKDVITTDRHVFFWNGWPSQWHPSEFTIDGIAYNCCEQFMMAEKARVFRDAESERTILRARDPHTQKAVGRKVAGFDETLWNSVCRGIVYRGNLAKFLQNADLALSLMETGERVIVEASPYDRIWGIGLGPDDARIHDEASWQGHNWLGIAVMQVRDQFHRDRGDTSRPFDAELKLQLERRSALA
jgi:ribA/ribD-fused uncharacterized protein